MTIRKVKGLESDFTIVPNQAINDKLSWAARGMLLYLCSKPDDWEVFISDLVKQTTGSAKKSGRDAVRKIMDELIECGYMRKSQNRISGKFDRNDYEVSFQPFTENPYTVNPSTANPTQQSTDINKGKIEQSNTDIFPSEKRVHLEDIFNQYNLSNCSRAVETLKIINELGCARKAYTGSLTLQEWLDCECAMRSVDDFDFIYFTWWMETRSAAMTKTPSLPNMLCDCNGIDFEQFYFSTFVEEWD